MTISLTITDIHLEKSVVRRQWFCTGSTYSAVVSCNGLTQKWAKILTSKTLLMCASFNFRTSPPYKMPALFTRISTSPMSRLISSAVLWMSSDFVTSTTYVVADSPILLISVAVDSLLTYLIKNQRPTWVRVNECCLMPTQQFFNYIMARTS